MSSTTSLPELDPSQHLHEGWRIREYVPGQALQLEQENSETQRRMRSQGLVLALSLMSMVPLWWTAPLAFSANWMWLAGPWVALMGMVAVLSLLALRKSLQQLREGVVLRLNAKTRQIEGLPHVTTRFSWGNFNSKRNKQPLENVARIHLRVFKAPSGRETSRAELGVELQGASTSWMAPSAWAPYGEEAAARDALFPLGVALARIAQCELRVDYVDESDHESWTAAELCTELAKS